MRWKEERPGAIACGKDGEKSKSAKAELVRLGLNKGGWCEWCEKKSRKSY